MRRIHAIVAIVALLTVPLAPIAWGMACEASSAPMMCCLPHSLPFAAGQTHDVPLSGKSGNHLPNVGLIAPIPPATLAALVKIDAPEDARRIFFAFSQSTTPGFLPAPFEPPRT